MNIKKLDKNTISLISAGEVIECPADVLKELIENSIDANAENISVTIKSSGIDFIEVVDDGCGISKEDLKLCLDKYTTSKITTIDDLYSLNSYGFRGEALSSINSVSVVEVVSSKNDNGKAYFLDSNKNLKQTSFKKGTKITIKDLFYNLPVRKKFLKSKSAEFSKMYDTFLEFVIINPQIKFTFTSEKKNLVFYKTTQENRFYQVFGKELANQIINVDFTSGFYKVKGFILKPSSNFVYTRNFTYINNRAVYFSELLPLIKSIYKDYLMVQQKPFYVLFFKIQANTIDVNVHPKKRIVKLQNHELFLLDLKQKLSSLVFSKKGKEKDIQKASTTYFKTIKQQPTHTPTTFFEKKDFKQNYFDSPKEEPLLFNNKKIERVLGQIHNTYIVCEIEDGFLLVDQHAAAERINLEKNQKKDLTEKQKLLSKKHLSFLNENQKEFLKNQKKMFNDLGFDYEVIDEDCYLTTIPFFLKTYFDTNVFVNLLNDLQSKTTEDFTKTKLSIIKKYSCSESIKSNQPLSLYEIKELIRKLDACKHKLICAHGRPTTIHVSLNDLEKMFKRIV